MTIEEIRKNAPLNADFYMIDNGEIEYIRCHSGHWFLWLDGCWSKVNLLVMQQHRDKLRRLHPCV